MSRSGVTRVSRTRARRRGVRRKRRGLSVGKLTYSSSSPKKNWSEHILTQNMRPKLRTAQLSQTHRKQIGHLLRRVSWSLAWQTTQFADTREYSMRPRTGSRSTLGTGAARSAEGTRIVAWGSGLASNDGGVAQLVRARGSYP